MEYNKLLNIIKTGVGITHPATFHADDVLATCLLRLINPKFRVKRSNVIPSSFDGLIYDIGLKEYDHHQVNAEIRKNGIKYASFGLLWRDLSPYFLRLTDVTMDLIQIFYPLPSLCLIPLGILRRVQIWHLKRL